MILFMSMVACGAVLEKEESNPPSTIPATKKLLKNQQKIAKTRTIPTAANVRDKPVAKIHTGPDVERRLYPHRFSASSHLANDWNKFKENYLAAYVGDDDPKTSWTEGKDDVGLGEWIEASHTTLTDASKLRLKIRNGYQKSSSLFSRNARAKSITLKLLPSGIESKHVLKDKQGWQELEAVQPTGVMSGYQITVHSVYKGTHYEDLVISDIQTYVTAKTPDNPTFEASKQKTLLTWIKERKTAAKAFKKAAKGMIPIASSYMRGPLKGTKTPTAKDDELDNVNRMWPEHKATVAMILKEYENSFTGWKQVRLSLVNKQTIPSADGVFFYNLIQSQDWDGGYPSELSLPMIRRTSIFFSDQLNKVFVGAKSINAERALGYKPNNTLNCKKNKKTLVFAAPEKLGNHIVIIECGMLSGREEDYQASGWQSLSYDKQGRLSLMMDGLTVTKFFWENVEGSPRLRKAQRVNISSIFAEELIGEYIGQF